MIWDGDRVSRSAVWRPSRWSITDEDEQVHSWLQRVHSDCVSKHAQNWLERVATEFVLKLLKKRLFSSPAAFARPWPSTSRRYRGRTQGQTRQIARRPTAGILRRPIAQIWKKSTPTTMSIEEQPTLRSYTATSILQRP